MPPLKGGGFLFSEPQARTFIRTDRRFRFAPRTTIDADGTVQGYASLFGEIDQARDMVMRGAFADTLVARGLRRIPMLFQHDPSEPVGIWLELREDHRVLFARVRLIPDVRHGQELLSLLRAGAIDGLSIGFRTAKARIDPRTRIRRIYAVDLGRSRSSRSRC